MAKAPTSVIGVDLGRYALKSVILQRRGPDRVAITNYASRPIERPIETADQLARELKALFKQMGGTAKTCAVAVSSPDTLLRIIEQPETPTDLLREALRLNGMVLLNQDCREFVIDCDRLVEAPPHVAADGEASHQSPMGNGRKRYLVGGIPRTQVTQIAQAMESCSASFGALQLAPVSLFNAFEFAHSRAFNEQAFFLVDIGHTSSTMMIGAKRELVLVRNIDFGGKILLESLMALSGESRESVVIALEQEDELMVENTRMALMVLTREVGSSIGFFEGRREETIGRVFVSGGPAKSATLLKVMSEEIHMPCQSWNPVEACEVNLPSQQRDPFASHVLDLHVAYGAASELLNA
jgi:Tfp pilus assembly PilM family ATPase